MNNKKLNLFYEEPDPDRWFKYDRYIRKVIRRIIRGKPRPGGVMMVALELMRGLDKIGIEYRLNNYKYAKAHPNELIGVIGKPQLIFNKRFKNPILFGAGVFSHPIDCPDLFIKYSNIKKILVPGEWMRKMFEPYYGSNVISWPVGIDTTKWHPNIKNEHLKTDFLIYEKILWDKEDKYETILKPITKILEQQKLTFEIIRYGNYKPTELIDKLSNSKAVVFLGEHETQGLAYQQILATNTPIIAWNKGEYWLDPSYYPERVMFSPVSSVPYWDQRCGVTFKTIDDFRSSLEEFNKKLGDNFFNPRDYILANLTLEICAQNYVDIYNKISNV